MQILFDIGGTKTRIARLDKNGDMSEPIVYDTSKMYGDGLSRLLGSIRELADTEEISKIAGGIAGPWDRSKNSLISSPNLPDWVGKPLKQTLEDEFQAKVYVENDAAMVGLGEATYGAGRDFGIVVYFTVSTGVGGARIVDGRIDEKVIGFEPGHQIVDMDRTIFPTEEGIDLESMIGGRWVEARMGKKPALINDQEFWEKMAHIIAVGLNNTIMHWSPDVVVLGGSMMNKIGVPLERVEAHLRQIVKIYPVLPPLKRSELGDLGGLYGAKSYLEQQTSDNS